MAKQDSASFRHYRSTCKSRLILHTVYLSVIVNMSQVLTIQMMIIVNYQFLFGVVLSTLSKIHHGIWSSDARR